MPDIASERYSKALFDIGKEKNRVESYLSQLKDIAEIFDKSKELQEFIAHPEITARDKKILLEKLFKNKVDDEVLELVYILNEHERFSQIKDVYKSYESFVLEHLGIMVAYVTTAVKLTEKESGELRDKLSRKYNTKIQINNLIDKDIIGGVYIKIGDEVIDGTVRGRLEAMKRQLMQEGGEISI